MKEEFDQFAGLWQYIEDPRVVERNVRQNHFF
jgi:hypothetical protein